MKKIFKAFFYFLILQVVCGISIHAQDKVELNIIPRPNFSLTTEGHTIMFDKGFIVIQNPSAINAAKYLKQYMRDQFELDYTITYATPDSRLTQIVFAPSKSYEPEAYEMEGSRNVVMINGTDKSSFWAVQSLIQLFEQFGAGRGLPAFIVRDQPRFPHRGILVDVGRHFMPVQEIKKLLLLMSFYKLNTFHWHLTEDQGWRVEIKKYPNLTRIGSTRKETILEKNFDPYIGNGKPHGGFYTQEQIKDIVAYAASLNIEIIPEIEMPGHAQAALASYPYLGCTGGPYTVSTKWGVSKEVFCAGKDSTFTFLENVLKEIIPLFPSKYIHLGGDECPKDRWKECANCQKRIKDEHLKDEHELQSYFVQRMEKFVNSLGKSMIGWDEILEGGLAPNATVMSWRGEQGGINAAQQNHDVIMTPNNYCYLDYYQSQDPGEPLAIGGYLPLEKVYSLDPIPAELTDEEAKHIRGLQGNLWTEYISTPEKLEYMLFPRALAIAEVGWTKLSRKNYEDFLDRVKTEFTRLDRLKVNHGQHLFGLTWSLKRKDGDMELTLKTRSNGSIRYTVDGTDPSPRSLLYRNPIEINKNMMLRAQVFENGKLLGAALNKQFIYHKAVGKEVTLKEKPHKNYDPGNASALCNGLEGTETFDDDQWFGYSGTDLEATIDLGKATWVKEFGFNYIHNSNAWIYPPASVTFYGSENGKEFAPLMSFTEFSGEGKVNRKAKMDRVKARYIRVVAKNYGKIPAGKTGEGHQAWLFMDEVTVD